MKVIEIYNSGYIDCKSSYYVAHTSLDEKDKFVFKSGINELVGDIDSGNFSISYLISMYKDVDKKLLFLPQTAKVDGEVVELFELSQLSCYMDSLYPFFPKKKTVRQLVEKGLKKSKIPYTPDEICKLFHMETFRFERPINAIGHEKFRAMAAIGFCYNKDVFCFPWMSRRLFDSFQGHLTDILSILEKMNKIVILPIGF